MLDQLTIEPMTERFILWRCLHSGPLGLDNIDLPPENPEVDWNLARNRNIPLLKKLLETYGACAVMARDGDRVVGTLRFYPKALCTFSDGGAGFCLLQTFPAGPPEDMLSRDFPPVECLADKTLFVHCMLIVAPPDDPEHYRRKGLGSNMARELIAWATAHGWSAIEANAYEDIPALYAISGVAGRRFWEKLGFHVVLKDVEPGIAGKFLDMARQSAVSVGIPESDAANRYRMRLELHEDEMTNSQIRMTNQ